MRHYARCRLVEQGNPEQMQFIPPIRLPSVIVIKGDFDLSITEFAILNLNVPFAPAFCLWASAAARSTTQLRMLQATSADIVPEAGSRIDSWK